MGVNSSRKDGERFVVELTQCNTCTQVTIYVPNIHDILLLLLTGRSNKQKPTLLVKPVLPQAET